MEENLNKAIEEFYEGYNGAEDLRSEEEKAKDFLQSEFVAEISPVEWKEKKEEDWRTFPIQQQFFTSKCVAFTTAKLATINYWLKTKEFLLFSPNSIYEYRSNKPDGGMIGEEAFKIWTEKGISLEAVARSNQIQESDPYTLSLFSKEVAKGFKLSARITIPEGDFDRVASTIQATGKGVMVWFYFTSREWGPEFPKIMDNLTGPYDKRSSRHSVTATDFGLIGGKEFLRIEDSAKFGNRNVRYISREFFEARNFLTKYPMSFNYEEAQVLPPVLPPITKTLKFGMNDPEVKILQDILKAKGFFPTNVGSATTFGAITLRAVKDFQKAKGLVDDGVVGTLTRKALNQ